MQPTAAAERQRQAPAAAGGQLQHDRAAGAWGTARLGAVTAATA